MKKKAIFLIIIFVCILLTQLCAASKDTDESAGNFINIEKHKTYENDIMGIYNYIEINGKANGNVIAFAKSFNAAGQVEGIFVSGANSMSLSGNFNKDAVLAGAFVNISGAKFSDDVTAFCAYSFESNKESVFGDDVYIYSTDSAVLRGHIKGDVIIKANSVTIDAVIDKDAVIYSDNIALSQNAKISGNFKYSSSLNASIDQNAVISGKVEHIKIPAVKSKNTFGTLSIIIAFFKILLLILIAWILMRLNPQFMKECTETLKQRPGASFFAGLGILFFSAFLSAILIAFIITVIPGLFVLGSYALLTLISIIPFAHIAAQKFSRIENKHSAVALSIFIISVLGYLPYIGFFITFIVTCMGAGCIFKTFITKLRKSPLRK